MRGMVGSRRAPARARPALAARLGDLLLTLLAVAGSVCLLLVILSVTLNISIMMFKTGSMSPTITAGSIALVREIPASELEVGDIATVQRGDGELPVTHRVTEITHIGHDGTVTFAMKGDGNDTADVDPYSAATVQRVFFSVPGLAPLIQKFNSPYVLGGLTLGAAALVVWAFWPRGQDDEESPELQAHDQSGTQYSMLLPAAALAAALAFVPASREPAIHNVEGQYLRLSSNAPADMSHMSPGQSATWTTDVWAEAPEAGSIDVALRIPSQQAQHLPWELSVISCPVSGAALSSGCSERPRELLSDDPASGLAGREGTNIASFSSEERYRFQVIATLPSGTPANQDIAALQVQLIATGLGEEVSASPDQPQPDSPDDPPEDNRDLAETGPADLPLLLGSAAICAALGFGLRAMNRRLLHG